MKFLSFFTFFSNLKIESEEETEVTPCEKCVQFEVVEETDNIDVVQKESTMQTCGDVCEIFASQKLEKEEVTKEKPLWPW